MPIPDFLIDKRVVQRNLAKRLVDPKEYDKLLAGLRDVQDNAETSSADPGRTRGEASEG